MAWMCSDGHRNNIMSCDYDSVGTGVATGGSYQYWYTQDFGCSSGRCNSCGSYAAAVPQQPAPQPAPIATVPQQQGSSSGGSSGPRLGASQCASSGSQSILLAALGLAPSASASFTLTVSSAIQGEEGHWLQAVGMHVDPADLGTDPDDLQARL